MYQGEGWLILSVEWEVYLVAPSVSRGGVVDSQPMIGWPELAVKCIKGRGG